MACCPQPVASVEAIEAPMSRVFLAGSRRNLTRRKVPAPILPSLKQASHPFRRRFMRTTRFSPRCTFVALFCAPLLALTGCGGGGGDGGTSADTPAQASLVITAANAKPVAADALDSATDISAARSGSSFITSAQVEPAAAAASPALRLARAATTLAAKSSAASGLVLGVAVNETLPCSQGGSVTVTGNVASRDSFAVGDSVTLTSAGCRELIDGVTTAMSGSITLGITGGSFAPGSGFPRHVVMTIRATSFAVSVGAETSTSTGDMSLDLTENSSDSTSVVLTGAALGNQVTTSTGSRSFTMRGYRQALAISGSTTSYSVTGDIETNNSRLGTGVVSYHLGTPTALVASSAGAFSGGSLRVDGNASALLLTVTGTDTFQLQVDANGDGTFDASSTVTLAGLRALL
jgi:hypothetical protein